MGGASMSVDNIQTLDSLFGGCSSNFTGDEIMTINILRLIPYSKHPFKIQEGDVLDELVASIQEHGVMVPLLVRNHPILKGKYELLAGHHRKVAAIRAGLIEVTCMVKDVDDSTAALIVIDSNKQRGFSDMLPSEIAKSLKLEYDALKCQGKRTDLMKELESILHEKKMLEKNVVNFKDSKSCLTSRPVVEKLKQGNEFSQRSTQRYIRLNYLIPSLLDMVDDGKIAIRPAVDISFLREDDQRLLSKNLETSGFHVDMKKSEQLKDYSIKRKLSSEVMLKILSGNLFAKKEKQLKEIKLQYKIISKYINTSLDPKEVEAHIINALEYYAKNKQ